LAGVRAFDWNWRFVLRRRHQNLPRAGARMAALMMGFAAPGAKILR
jgi:hypothetical protein